MLLRIFIWLFLSAFCTLAPAQLQAQRSLSIAEVQQDLQTLRLGLETIHPALLRYQTQEQYDTAWAVLDSNALNPMTDIDLYMDLQWLLAQLRCVHTAMDEPPPSISEYIRVIPFLFIIRDGKIIVTHSVIRGHEIPEGSVIETINKVSADEMLQTFLQICPSDGFNPDDVKYRKIEKPEFFDLNQTVWYPLPRLFRITYFDAKTGRRRQITTESITRQRRYDLYLQRYGEYPSHDSKWSFSVDVEQNTAYLSAGSFNTWQMKTDFRAFYDSAFAAINASGVDNLIVDVRGNTGGTTMAAVELARWIAKKPFRWNKQRLVQSIRYPELEDYIDTWDKAALMQPDSIFTPLDNGMFEKKSDYDRFLSAFQPQPNAFKGRVFMLTDEHNSSATASLAAIAKTNKMATLVGGQTGGSAVGPVGGVTIFLTLPNSKIKVKIPAILNLNAVVGFPDGIGVFPDLHVEVRPEDEISGNDVVLQYVQKLIAESDKHNSK